MPGLDPGIHAGSRELSTMDPRAKPEDDNGEGIFESKPEAGNGRWGQRCRLFLAGLLVPCLAALLAGCSDPLPPAHVHDAADRMFLDLVLIARRNTLPTQDDTTLLIKAMDEIKRGNDTCAQWKLDQILTIGMPLVVQMVTADEAEQQQIRRAARRQLQQASALQVPDFCHGHSFPPATFK
jgi:hypothetical protein